MKATVLQIVGLVSVVTAAAFELGWTGALGAAGASCVYVGLAMEPRR